MPPVRIKKLRKGNLFRKIPSHRKVCLNHLIMQRVDYRNMCMPVEYFMSNKTFKQKNELFIEMSLKYSILAIEQSLEKAGINKKEITDLIFITSTGISTPSIDALIINKMKLNPNINRYPVWDLVVPAESPELPRQI